MATAEEIVVKLTAQTAQLKAGMAEGAAVVKTTQDEMAASMTTSMNAFRQFDDITKQSVQSTEGLAAAQKALDAARASGAFTTEELAVKEALVADAMRKVGTETQAASGIMSAFTRNSRTMYSTSALITDAMTGQFSRMRREVAALGNETGLMARAFQLLVSPAGVAGLAVAGLGVAFVEAADRFSRFQQTILSTGDIIGMTAGQLQTMSDDVGLVTGASFDAVDAINSIGRSGLFTGEQLRTAAESAVYFSQVTGENMDKAARVIEQLQEKPKEAIVKLNDQYHFLTQSQAELIVQLLQTGQNAQAAAVAVQAFHDAMADRAQEMNANTTALARDWHDVKQWTEGSAEALAEYLNLLGGSKDTTDQLNRAYIQLANDQSALFKIAHPFTNQADAINKDMQAIDGLRNKQAEEEAQAKKTAQANKDAATTLDNGVGNGSKGSGMSGLEQQFKEQEAAQHRSYEERLQDESDFLGKALENDKLDAAQRGDVWKRLQDIRHQMDEQTYQLSAEAARKQTEASRQAAEAAKQAAEGRARAEQRADSEIAAEAKQAYAEMRQAALTTAETTQQAALSRIATARQTARAEYSEGDITAAQLLQIENSLVSQKLAAEMAYLKAKMTLDQGDVNAQQKDAAKIKVDTDKAHQEMLANQQQYLTNAEQQWKQYTQRVSGMVSSQVSAMLFQHQTLRAAIANIAESMATTWIANEVKTLVFHEGVEQGKTAASEAGEAERLALTAAGQAESLAVQGASAIKWIMTEAAKAAAGAFNAMVSIPYIGPFVAVGASIAAGAAVMALVGKVASAEGGWERVPADGMQTMLHKDEMVLPKRVADPIRNMARGGGNGGGATHVHIHAMDAGSFKSFLKKNPGAMSAALAHAGRNGW